MTTPEPFSRALVHNLGLFFVSIFLSPFPARTHTHKKNTIPGGAVWAERLRVLRGDDTGRDGGPARGDCPTRLSE